MLLNKYNSAVIKLPSGVPVHILRLSPIGCPELVRVLIEDQALRQVCSCCALKVLKEVDELEATLRRVGLRVVNELAEEIN